MRAARVDDFDLSTREGRYQARKAGFDVPKRKPGPPQVDVMALVRIGAGCWEWQGAVNCDGYGTFTRQYRRVMAHRAVWEAFNGRKPGPVLMHTCDNPRCCNPVHLVEGTHKTNQADKFEKGRQAKGSRVGTAVLTESQVLEMRRRYVPRVCTYEMLAAEFGVHRDTVQKAVRGKLWRHL